MVSEDLRNLAAHLRRLMDEEQTSPKVFFAAIDRLDVHAGQVAELERVVVPASATLDLAGLPPNVVALAQRLHREGVRVGAGDIEGGGS